MRVLALKVFTTVFFLSTFFVVGATSPAHAQFDNLGSAIGSEIPDFTLQDSEGNDVSYDVLKGDKGLVMAFVRSAEWCPYCQLQLQDIGKHEDALNELGYNLVSVSYDSVAQLGTFDVKYDIPYVMVSDPESELIKAFGILNETVEPESRAYGIPHPAIFVIHHPGIIAPKYYEEDYKERPDMNDIITAIKKDATAAH